MSEYGKRDRMAQNLFFGDISTILFFKIYELQNKLLSVSLPKRKAKL